MILSLATLNCNYPKGVDWQKRLIKRFINEMEPDILGLQELRHRVSVPGYREIQGVRRDGTPNGEALLIKGPEFRTGKPYHLRRINTVEAFEDLEGNEIHRRVIPWAMLHVPIGHGYRRLLILNNHRPPKRMQKTHIDEENDATVRSIFKNHPARFKAIVGDLNNTGDPDCYNLPSWKYYGEGIDQVVANSPLQKRMIKRLTYIYPTDDGHKGTLVYFDFD